MRPAIEASRNKMLLANGYYLSNLSPCRHRCRVPHRWWSCFRRSRETGRQIAQEVPHSGPGL